MIYVGLVRAASIGFLGFKLHLLEAAGHHLSGYEHGAILLLLSMWTALFIVVAVFLVLAHDLSGGLAIFKFLVLLLPERSLSNLPLSLVCGKLLRMFGFQEGL